MSLFTVVSCQYAAVGICMLHLTRRRYVLGHEAMKRMGASNVLIAGLKGLGVEIGRGTHHHTAWMAVEVDLAR